MNQARQYSQKPGAIRERARMNDVETKWRKDRARLLVRVRAGTIPNEDSQEKYKLSLAEINVVRADAGLPELDRPYRANAFAGMMAINAETERLQGEVLEQMTLTQNLKDDVKALDQRMKQMVVEEQGRRVVVPAGEQFTLETIVNQAVMILQPLKQVTSFTISNMVIRKLGKYSKKNIKPVDNSKKRYI